MEPKQKITRKLSAILSADIKGYSLLMTNDEASTIQTLKDGINQVKWPVSKKSNGSFKQPIKTVASTTRTGYGQTKHIVPHKANEVRPEQILPFDDKDDFKDF